MEERCKANHPAVSVTGKKANTAKIKSNWLLYVLLTIRVILMRASEESEIESHSVTDSP